MNEYTPPTLDELLADMCTTMKVSLFQITGSSRKRSVSWPRQMFCYVAFFYTKWPITQIAATVGGRDHTTAIHCRDHVDELIETNDSEFIIQWEEYKEKSKYFSNLKLVRQKSKTERA